MKKNLEVVVKELDVFSACVEIQYERMLREPSWLRKGHILFGILPDTFRYMPRTLAYLVVILVPVVVISRMIL
jgi:hypothetical protein